MKTIHELAREGSPIETPFIDVHGHFGPWNETFVPWARDHARLIGEMDRFGCDMIWMTASDPGYAGPMDWKNDFVFELAEKHPGRIVPYCTLSANEQSGCAAELKRCLARGPCVGVKMHLYKQPAFKLDAAFLQPVLELLAERRLVFMHHDLGGADIIRWACAKYPELTFLAGHINPTANDLAKEFPNLRDCTCAAMAPDALGKEVRRAGSSSTMLVGSDAGLFTLAFGLGMVAYADMSERDKRNILGLNSLALLQRMAWFKLEAHPRLAAKLRALAA